MEKRQIVIAAIIGGLLVMGGIAGCGYGFRGSVNNLPADIRGIHIPIFRNATNEAGAETAFANALIYEFTRSGNLAVVPADQAEAILTGTIKSAAIESVAFATQTTAVDRKITIVLEVSFRRADNKKILWQNLALSRYENFKVVSDPNQTDRNKEEAIRKIAQDLAERIHNGILENF